LRLPLHPTPLPEISIALQVEHKLRLSPDIYLYLSEPRRAPTLRRLDPLILESSRYTEVLTQVTQATPAEASRSLILAEPRNNGNRVPGIYVMKEQVEDALRLFAILPVNTALSTYSKGSNIISILSYSWATHAAHREDAKKLFDVMKHRSVSRGEAI
jgi:hypothetical protein